MKKIAIVNRTNLKNYGSVLQCYALCEAVKKLGFESEIIWEQGNVSKNYDFRPHKIFMTALKLLTHPFLTIGVLKSMKEVKSKPVSEEKAQKFDAFVDDCITQRLFPKKELSQIAKGNEFAKFICGSDQVWCSTTMYVDPLMYLRFAPKAKRIAYAPSIGRDYIPTYNQRQMKKYISEIPYVSIREEEGKKIIKDLTGRDVPVVLDPTLLLPREDWVKLAKSEIQSNDKYAVLYFLDEPEELNQKQIMKFLRNNHLSAFSIGQNFSNVEKAENIKCPSCGPKDFLSLIRDAEIVITDSYHGSPMLAVKKSDIEKKGITFNEKFGSGSSWGGGEDSLFEHSIQKSGMKIYEYPATIATVDYSNESKWFHGYTKQYFYNLGGYYQYLYKRNSIIKFLWMMYNCYKLRKEKELSSIQKMHWMYLGGKGIKKNVTYTEFLDRQKRK